MASRFEVASKEYIKELKDEWKWKHEEKHGGLQECFKKVGKCSRVQGQFYAFRNSVILPSFINK